MFFVETDKLVQEYVEMIRKNTFSVDDVPCLLNLREAVRRVLEK